MQWSRTHRAIGLLALVLVAHPTSASAQQRSAVPTPQSVFGFPVGADSQLVGYDQSIDYFKRVAAASSRIKLVSVGKTSTGHPWTAAIISSPQNLARLDHFKALNQRLAHPEGLSDSAARRIAREARVIVDISGGLHASEIAGSQHTIQLAYELLSRPNDPATKAILDNVIFFLWPSINPDGQDIVVNWCKARDQGKNPGPMELYQKYIGHDNNRDSYMLNVVESRVIQRTWREWEPDIIYVHHQSSPFPTRIWVPPFADPVGQRVPGLMARQVNAIGTRIAQELEQEGRVGTTHQGDGFDAWYPGYIDYMPMYQNIPSWWTETQGGNCATPRISTVDSLPTGFRDLRPTTMYLSPWAGGRWGLRDAVDYMVTASKATLSYAATYREELLYNRYQSGRNTIQQYRASAPYAYIIPQQQHDLVAPVELLRRMAFMGVRVKQLGTDASYDGVLYRKGTWVIPMDQEYAQLVRELFEPQKYPEMGDDLPYDAAGWTLPYQMDVDVVEGKVPLPADFKRALQPVQGAAVAWRTAPDEPFTTSAAAAGIVPAPSAYGITGAGNVVALDPAQNNTFRLVNRALEAGAAVRFTPASNGTGARYLVTGADSAQMAAWASQLWVRGERVSSSTTSSAITAASRVALYKASPGNMDEGWTEWLFDTHDFAYTLITPADLRAGNLGDRFDVIVLASQGITGGRGGRGGGGAGGANAQPSAAADSAAAEDSSRVRAIDAFVRGGGTVVAWNQGTTNAINALKLPVRNVVAGVPRKDYFTGGSIMRALIDVAHPLMSGMPSEADVFVSGSPVFTTADGFQGSVIAKYPTEGSPLRSGFLNGEKLMQGMAAALDVKLDRGHVVLFAFQPQWRGQPQGTFRVVFNSAFFGRDIAAQAKGTPGFWSPPAPVQAASPVKTDTVRARAPQP